MSLFIQLKYIDSGIEKEEETRRYFRNAHLCFVSLLNKLQ